MPKVKTNSAAKKRFTFTGTGKIKRRHAYKSHILTKKSKKRKRNIILFINRMSSSKCRKRPLAVKTIQKNAKIS